MASETKKKKKSKRVEEDVDIENKVKKKKKKASKDKVKEELEPEAELSDAEGADGMDVVALQNPVDDAQPTDAINDNPMDAINNDPMDAINDNPNDSIKFTPSDTPSTLGLPYWLVHPILISPLLEQTPESAIDHPRYHLSRHIQSRLQENNISYLFPVQQAVWPRLLSTRFCSASISPGDVCVKASTGSGKTLAYVVPIVETLLDRIVPRVRALIVLPTRDLAAQVKHTFDAFVKGTDLKVGLLTGQQSFVSEQQSIVSKEEGHCRVDIIVATPGRLMDHLQSTPGLTLEHLRFLVMDEADRLLHQHYHDWLANVIQAAERPSLVDKVVTQRRADGTKKQRLQDFTPFQKLLFSATLTRNPGKIASLQLKDPIYIAVDTAQEQSSVRYILPSTLQEKRVTVKDAAEKPLVLMHLLFHLELKGVLVFVKSVEAAHRLAALLNIVHQATKKDKHWFELSSDEEDGSDEEGRQPKTFAAAFSSSLTLGARKKLLGQFQRGTLTCIICSEVMARGIDLGSSVSVVVNYDIPSRVKSHVHRIGRTARAGRSGVAYTLLEGKQVKWFKHEIEAKIAREHKIDKMQVDPKEYEDLVSDYHDALKRVGQWVKGTSDMELLQETRREEKESDASSSDASSSDSDASDDSSNDSDSSDSGPSPSIDTLQDSIEKEKNHQIYSRLIEAKLLN